MLKKNNKRLVYQKSIFKFQNIKKVEENILL